MNLALRRFLIRTEVTTRQGNEYLGVGNWYMYRNKYVRTPEGGRLCMAPLTMLLVTGTVVSLFDNRAESIPAAIDGEGSDLYALAYV